MNASDYIARIKGKNIIATVASNGKSGNDYSSKTSLLQAKIDSVLTGETGEVGIPLTIVPDPEVQFYVGAPNYTKKQISVLDNNYSGDANYSTSTNIGGGFPTISLLAVGYTFTGPGIPTNTKVVGYRFDRSNPNGTYRAIFIDLDKEITYSGRVPDGTKYFYIPK